MIPPYCIVAGFDSSGTSTEKLSNLAKLTQSESGAIGISTCIVVTCSYSLPGDSLTLIS